MWGFFYVFKFPHTYISNDVFLKIQLFNSSIFIGNKLGKQNGRNTTTQTWVKNYICFRRK